MSHSPATTTQSQRLRIHFRKDDMLRWISHRDLMRMFERLVRRAALQLAMSRGYHPKPKIHFVSALALGVLGCDEVVEMELENPPDPQQVQHRLAEQAPSGLSITKVEVLAPGTPKGQAVSTHYAIDLPPDRIAQVDRAIGRLAERSTITVLPFGQREPMDVPVRIAQLRREDNTLYFSIPASHSRSARPLELLAALELDDLLRQGYCLRRTKVELKR